LISIALVIYLLVGVGLVVVGPAGKDISREVDEIRRSSLVKELQGRDGIPESKVLAYRVILSLGAILLWPVFLSSFLQGKTKSIEAKQDEKEQPVMPGLRFQHMGGNGAVRCCKCDYSEEITSFTHGINACSTGYQCQTCGKFASRSFKQPFPEYEGPDHDESLDDVPQEYRPHVIRFIQSMIDLIERQMPKTPKESWLPSWEPDLAKYRKELSRVSPEELEHIQKVSDEANAAYSASLFCECGGALDREQVLFCPKCRSTNMAYRLMSIS
jgi:hypothetical protein